MERGQLISQPFIYIFALVVAALVLLFGAKVVIDLQEKADYIELTTSIAELRDTIKAYYNFEEGSSKDLLLKIPKKVGYICFINPKEGLTKTKSELDKLDLELYDNLKYSETHNLFIVPLDSFSLTKYKIPYLKSLENPLCVKTNGKLEITIENVGDSVLVS